jgi:hypothetical protein
VLGWASVEASGMQSGGSWGSKNKTSAPFKTLLMHFTDLFSYGFL